ncbi:MAG: hypothetical protein HYU81_02035 [Candidatus Brennerbacteria bacterium]|nr:hypothetical protein [Candidatus Brennerbacteria bacterium]
MTRRTIIAVFSPLAAAFFLSGAVFLESPFLRVARAQTPAVQKAFEEVKTKLDDLVSAKDENLADDLGLRIQTFKKVVEFSEEEAKTLKVKLIATELKEAEWEEDLKIWKVRAGERLAAIEQYYEETLETLTEHATTLDLVELKTIVGSFKDRRESSFTPLAAEIEEFLLVANQRKALDVAEARFIKIEGDVKKLERAKIRGIAKLPSLLAKAKFHLTKASDAYGRASELFFTLIAPPAVSEKEGAMPLLAAEVLESAPNEDVIFKEGGKEKKEDAPSIRDEVRASLEAVKRTYQVFIDMSAEVKKILK